MFPASLQVPGAIVLLGGGLLACFLGYRLFRIVLGVYGFILGALVGTSALGAGSTTMMILAAIVGGVIGAVILVAAYFVGVALVGAGVGAAVVHLVWSAFGAEPHAVVVILFALAGAFAALALQRYVIVAGTAFGGAWTAIVGALALAGDRAARGAAAKGDVWILSPFDLPAGRAVVLGLWLLLGVAGLVVQLAVTAKGRPRP